MKICEGCYRKYKPSSNHKLCPKCRYENGKRLCPDGCGKLVSIKYDRCVQCNNKKMNKLGMGTLPDGHRRRKYGGYMLIKLSAHPRADKNGMLFEHIVVMEKYLERYLEKGENVHHINGIKDDNRIENLELWIRPQPSGIRAEDAVKWAEDIIKKYKGKL